MWETRLGRTMTRVRKCAQQRHLHGCTEGGVDFAGSIVTQCTSLHLFVFFKKKKHWRTSGSQRLSVAKQVSFDPDMGTTRKPLERFPPGQNQEDGVKLTLPRFRKDPHPLLGDPTPGVPKKNGNAIVPRHDHQQNSGTLTDENRSLQ